MNQQTSLRSRFAALAGMAGGAAWVGAGTLHITNPDDLSTSAVETVAAHLALGLMAAALALTAPAVIELARYGSMRQPAYVAAGGMALLAVACTVSNIAGEDPTFFLVAAPLANLLWLAGSIGVAVSLRRAGDVPKAIAFGLPAVQVFALPLSMIGGPIVGGAYWLAVGYLLSVDGIRARRLAPAVA